jgi:hypothetical protein
MACGLNDVKKRFLKKSRNLWLHRLDNEITQIENPSQKRKSVESSFEICVIRDYWSPPIISRKNLDTSSLNLLKDGKNIGGIQGKGTP